MVSNIDMYQQQFNNIHFFFMQLDRYAYIICKWVVGR